MKSGKVVFYVGLSAFVAFVMLLVYQLTFDTLVTVSVGGIVSLILFLVILKKEKNAKKKQKEPDAAVEALREIIAKQQDDAKELYEKLKEQEIVSWQDILSLTSTLEGMRDNPPVELIVKADWLSLLKVSVIKNKIIWKDDLTVALDRIKSSYDKCMDDILIEKLIEKVKSLEIYSSRKGYSTLRNQVHYRCQSLPVYLKEADKEVESV